MQSNERIPLVPQTNTKSFKWHLVLGIVFGLGVVILSIGLIEKIELNTPLYKGLCNISNSDVTYYLNSDGVALYNIKFNATVDRLEPPCCYTAIVFVHEHVYDDEIPKLVAEYTNRTVDCLYRKKNSHFPEGGSSNVIWIGPSSFDIARYYSLWLILIIIGAILIATPCLVGILFKCRTQSKPVSYDYIL